jgi:predicted phage terminase large subunit-like protein
MKNSLALKDPNELYDFILEGCRDRLGAFCSYIYPDFQMPDHIKLLISKLRAVERGEIKRLMVMMPPRHGKSQLISRLFPTWYIGRNPGKSVIFTTYSQEFADDFGRTVRNTINSEEYQGVFPECQLAMDSSSVKKFATTQNNNYFAVGAGGPLTGRGGDLIIIDDPIKNREEASSQLIRKKIIDWFSSTLYTRLSPTGAIVLVQTRWHNEDLAGYLYENQRDKWEVVSMPAVDNETNSPLWPERFSYAQLMDIKESVGSYDWASLYQQNPVPDGGTIIKHDWIREYDELPHVKSYSWSWDTAIKTGQENDYSVGQLWAECENGYYLVDMFRAKVEYPELRRMVSACYDKYRSSEVIVEDKASGQQIVQDFKRNSSMPVIPVIPGRDMPNQKEERLKLVSRLFEAGKIYIPKRADWRMDFIQEMVTFPNAKHDDIVDATTQYLARRLNQHNKTPNIRIL